MPFTCSDCGKVFMENGAIRKDGVEVGNWRVICESMDLITTWHQSMHQTKRMLFLAKLGAAIYIENFLRWAVEDKE